MDLAVQIKMNPSLYVKDPEQSDLGKRIVQHSIDAIYEYGFEDFTFKKLASRINTTEASVYRYFENKHRLLTYITSWFWTWMEYQLVFYTNNLTDTQKKIDILIDLLVFNLEDKLLVDHINKGKLQQIIISEANKSYLTNHIDEDNKAQIFKPYKDLCHRISEIFVDHNSKYKYSHSLSSTLIETAHHQMYFQRHLPSLTDFGKTQNNKELVCFLKDFIYKTLGT
ncbi:MAG: TetR/AcrR family transcriptional regulator [Flavipsychrobacter sp.]